MVDDPRDGSPTTSSQYEVKQMSPASYGLPTDVALGYDKRISLAVRLSNSGIFVHAAPWSVADQGVRNVSHGCITSVLRQIGGSTTTSVTATSSS